jgi:hypothetical protein
MSIARAFYASSASAQIFVRESDLIIVQHTHVARTHNAVPEDMPRDNKCSSPRGNARSLDLGLHSLATTARPVPLDLP